VTDASTKRFFLLASAIRPLATSRGSCIASDHITVEGRPVCFMYREEPSDEIDSGWRFLSGAETQEYLDTASNLTSLRSWIIHRAVPSVANQVENSNVNRCQKTRMPNTSLERSRDR
jgi:hypothetical protein